MDEEIGLGSGLTGWSTWVEIERSWAQVLVMHTYHPNEPIYLCFLFSHRFHTLELSHSHFSLLLLSERLSQLPYIIICPVLLTQSIMQSSEADHLPA